MRPFAPQTTRSLNNIFKSATTTITTTTTPRQLGPQLGGPIKMSASTDAGELRIENTNITTAPGVTLSERQQTLVGSVLDLFAGRPSLAKLQLWKDDATFADPITSATGRQQYEAQWYGLQTAFSEIERLSHEVTSAGNPIEMDLKTRYKVKGIGMEKVIQSKVNIFTDGEKISKVEDKWDGQLPEGAIANAFRRLNAVSVPKMVGVPSNAEEDAKRGN